MDIVRDKDGNYQGFHNVCRHRAYPVVTKSTGSSLVVGCKVVPTKKLYTTSP